MTKTARLEVLIWVLIYVGALTLCIGYFVARQDPHDRNLLGGALMFVGSVSALAGVVLIYTRSRLVEPPPRQDGA